MPVRTRSQRLRRDSDKESASSSEGCGELTSPPKPSDKAPKNTPIPRRKQSEKQEMDEKSEETPNNGLSSSSSSSHGIKQTLFQLPSQNKPPISPEAREYRAKYDEFRKSVRTLLDSPPNKVIPLKKAAPTPHVDRITIQENNQQMEFLIPPKQQDEPIEIREQIQAALNAGDEQPIHVPFNVDRAKSKSRSPSYPPIYNQDTQLYSPYAPSYNKKEADQTTQHLIVLIISILLAVFCAVYNKEIIAFVQPQITSLREMVGGAMNWIWNSVSNVFSAISGSSSNGNNGIENNENIGNQE